VVAGLLPAAILWVTLRNRQLEQQLPGETNSFNRYKILDFIYKPTCRWREVVVMFELAVLAAVAVFGHRLGPLHHTIAFCCVLAVMGLLQFAAQPYIQISSSKLFHAAMPVLLVLQHYGKRVVPQFW
jgi:hypothetical protein